MKQKIMQLIQESIKERWEKNKLPILINAQENIDIEDVDLVDVSFDMKQSKNLEFEYEQCILHFQVKGKEVKVDYLGEDESEDICVEELLPNNLYVIAENSENGGDVFFYEKTNVEYEMNYDLVRTLNKLEIREVIESYKDELKEAENEYVQGKDVEFFEKHKDYLSGVVSVKNSLGSTVTLILESGMPLHVRKFDIENWEYKQKGQ
ncbi:hypothetical protein CON36_34545 [Bacillus cereus]|uniref:Uncharacterized protein n=3 Tax=Bacillus cereus group TaxID=86661 RepID=A0A9X6ZPI6_BACTU|nr:MULTISPECIES: hypothetical protein [Bacillus cereus group]PDZ94284.1 hypothetical protein CON36_34545 [Bacillus cereus]PFJ24188.1 hypothetical protein COJ15_36825 [Bacillus thuringiensis]PGP11967.1 hypothetical protein COA01_34675 [Bacillus cereus]